MNKFRTYFLINITSFGIISYLIFKLNENKLFVGLDGNYLLSIARTQFLNGSNFYFQNNYLQGAGGNVNFPVNLRLDPGYIALSITNFQNLALGYLVWALMLFTASVIFTKSIGIKPRITFIIAWLLPVLALWPTPIRLYPLLAMTPHVATTISLVALLLTAITYGRHFKRNTILIETIGFGLFTIYLAITAPMNIFFIVPVVFGTLLARIWTIRTKTALFASFLAYGIPSFLVIIFGAYQFISGLFSYTAFNFYPEIFPSALATKLNRSSIFWGPNLLGISTGMLIFILAVIGTKQILQSNDQNLNMKIMARVIVFSIILLLALNLLTFILKVSTTKFPSPVYFEVFFWPILVIPIGYVVNSLIEYLPENSLLNSSVVVLIFIASVSSSTLLTVDNEEQRNTKVTDPISEYLSREFREPKSEFNGRVATFTGTNLEGNVSWIELFSNDRNNFAEFGTDFRTYKLWNAGIPTLTEYSPTLSPAFFNFTRENFERPGDKQVRNTMTLREFNQTKLELIGVKWIISDKFFEDLTLRAETVRKGTRLWLFELSNANLGSFTNTKMYVPMTMINESKSILLSSLETMNESARNQFKQLNLDELKSGKLYVQGNDYIFKGQTDGQSLAILPIEYSHCFITENLNPGPTNDFQVKSVDGLLLGIVFKGEIHISLKYKNGPFVNSNCRNLDADLFESFVKIKSN